VLDAIAAGRAAVAGGTPPDKELLEPIGKETVEAGPEEVWRLGHRDAPLDFTPRRLCGWQHRWDDILREYRTLYCADCQLTCLREVLADLRAEPKVVAELRELFGPETDALDGAAEVGAEFREARVLAPAVIERDGELSDLDKDAGLRNQLEVELHELLAAHGTDHLDIHEVRSREREVTQTVSRSLFERGYAGVQFGSNLDDQPCYALFEGRAELTVNGEPVQLAPELPELQQVCKEFSLKLV